MEEIASASTRLKNQGLGEVARVYNTFKFWIDQLCERLETDLSASDMTHNFKEMMGRQVNAYLHDNRSMLELQNR